MCHKSNKIGFKYINVFMCEVYVDKRMRTNNVLSNMCPKMDPCE